VKRSVPALDEYCRLVATAPLSVTSLRTPDAIRRELVDDALVAAPLIGRALPARVVDVGSGNGSPGIPLALAYGASVWLLESVARKAAFLRELVSALGVDGQVVAERSERYARGAGRDRFDLALARALAPPPVAAELCLPLVRPRGRVILWTGDADLDAVAAVAGRLAARVRGTSAYGGRMLVELEKLGETPDAFPRRPGMARKRPLAGLPSA
jgi:16S rRNA (guanine527-N7)-methyltransferase